MKLSEQWLREWVDPPFDRETLGERLTLAGLEVDGIDPVAPDLAGVVVATVTATAPVEGSDHLSHCRVDAGAGEVEVVCGAPNVRAGMLTAYAPPGTRLPGEREIAATTIRGVTSHGMLCSAAELELGDDDAGIMELDDDATPGQSLHDALGLDDHVLDIGLTPNRGDCFCVLGVARDLGVISERPLTEPEVPPVAPTHDAVFAAELADPAACPRYAGRIVRNIRAHARTPAWMAERLRRCGVRCIHPAVDVTNYVMLELGQPMHAFDLARLEGRIVVRGATAGERLELLDGQTLTLDGGTLVIADAARAVALAGVMGGAGTAVTDATTDIFFESALFDPVRLAGVARRYGLTTDASMRFERAVDISGQVRAIERATRLLMDICGGEPGPIEVAESAPHLPQRRAVPFDPAAVNRLLGTDIDDADSERVLRALGMTVTRSGDGWSVLPPDFRADIALEADLVEEVARIVGYDAIPVRLPQGAAGPALPVAHAARDEAVRTALTARGYFEAITYSFIAPQQCERFAPAVSPPRLSNPISGEMAVMRPSLWPGLVDSARYNFNRQADDVRLFEIGAVFGSESGGGDREIQVVSGVRGGLAQHQGWSETLRETDFFDTKQDVEELLRVLGENRPMFLPGHHPALHPGQAAEVRCGDRMVGFLGRLHPALERQLDLARGLYLFEIHVEKLDRPGPPQYRPVSRFPAVRRDLNIVLDEAVPTARCLAVAEDAAGAILKDLQLFDVYRGQGIDSDKKSLTLCLIFQDAYSTLREDDIEAAVARVIDAMTEQLGGRLRN